MSIETAPACALGLTHATLSALRDGFLPLVEQARLREHIAGCEACQSRLADFDAIAGEMRDQRVPSPDERLWRAVSAAIATRSRAKLALPKALAHRMPNKQIWGALGAAAAVLLVVAGFARFLSRPPTEQQPTPLSWHEVQLPAEFTAPQTYSSIGVAPGGQLAYACTVAAKTGSTLARIWTTRDAGQNWRFTNKMVSSHALSRCNVLADSLDPTVAVAILAWIVPGAPPSSQEEEDYATFDGGASWRQLDSGYRLGQLATIQGTTFALRGAETTTPGQYQPARLSLSEDRMRTWSDADDRIVAAGQHVVAFWVHPVVGDLMMRTDTGGLWVRDPSARWSQLPAPKLDSAVSRTFSLGPGTICGHTSPAGSGAQANRYSCSADGGRTWEQRSVLAPAFSCSTCAPPEARLIGIGFDGALLAQDAEDVARSGATTGSAIYRLTAGGGQWESLGRAPASALLVPGEVPDLLWAFSGGTDLPGGTQGFVGTSGHVFLATYPPGAPMATSAPTATPTPLPAHPLSWQPTTSPIDLTREINPPGLVVSPADGSTAYLCDGSGSGPRAWITRDRGAHWSATASLPSRVAGMPAGERFYGCGILADDLTPTTALAEMAWSAPGNGAGFTIGADYATFDGGRNWRQVGIDEGSFQYQQFASVGSTIYALRADRTQSLMPPYHIWVSADRMRTWRRVDAAIPEPVTRFWLDPASGALLAQGDGGGGESLGHLYASRDHGATWTQLNPPAFTDAWAQWAPGNGAWRICTALLGYMASGGGGEALACSDDGGATWSPQPALTPGATPGPPAFWLGLAHDESFLRVVPQPEGSNGPISRYTLYRLAPGLGQWQSLGDLPEMAVSYAGIPAGGVLWAAPDGGVTLDPQRRIFTADYP
jgi:hypothetical protein